MRAALAEQRPDVVLIEGPPEADGLVALAADEEMRPPVALLGYVPGEPQQAAFWPFAVFSPEWQAIGYALGFLMRSAARWLCWKTGCIDARTRACFGFAPPSRLMLRRSMRKAALAC